MRFRATNLTTLMVLIATLLAATFASSASAATTTVTAKEKTAVAVYAKALAQARAAYFVAVKPSRAAVIAIGKPAENKRRLAVATALASYLTVVGTAKAPSLAAQLNYRNAAAKATANSTNLSLKTEVKATLDALSKATVALKGDANVAAARINFTQSRVRAMAGFKATVAATVSKRDAAQKTAFIKFKIAKVKALAQLKVALKAASTKVTTKVVVKKK